MQHLPWNGRQVSHFGCLVLNWDDWLTVCAWYNDCARNPKQDESTGFVAQSVHQTLLHVTRWSQYYSNRAFHVLIGYWMDQMTECWWYSIDWTVNEIDDSYRMSLEWTEQVDRTRGYHSLDSYGHTETVESNLMNSMNWWLIDCVELVSDNVQDENNSFHMAQHLYCSSM